MQNLPPPSTCSRIIRSTYSGFCHLLLMLVFKRKWIWGRQCLPHYYAQRVSFRGGGKGSGRGCRAKWRWFCRFSRWVPCAGSRLKHTGRFPIDRPPSLEGGEAVCRLERRRGKIAEGSYCWWVSSERNKLRFGNQEGSVRRGAEAQPAPCLPPVSVFFPANPKFLAAALNGGAS